MDAENHALVVLGNKGVGKSFWIQKHFEVDTKHSKSTAHVTKRQQLFELKVSKFGFNAVVDTVGLDSKSSNFFSTKGLAGWKLSFVVLVNDYRIDDTFALVHDKLNLNKDDVWWCCSQLLKNDICPEGCTPYDDLLIDDLRKKSTILQAPLAAVTKVGKVKPAQRSKKTTKEREKWMSDRPALRDCGGSRVLSGLHYVARYDQDRKASDVLVRDVLLRLTDEDVKGNHDEGDKILALLAYRAQKGRHDLGITHNATLKAFLVHFLGTDAATDLAGRVYPNSDVSELSDEKWGDLVEAALCILFELRKTSGFVDLFDLMLAFVLRAD